MHPFLRWLSIWAVWLGFLQVGTIGVSLFQIVIDPFVGTMIVVTAAGAAMAVGHISRQAPATPCQEETRDPGPLALLVLLLPVAALYGLLVVAAWSKPDLSWDGCYYHLPTIQFWAQRGYVHWVDFPHITDGWWPNYLDHMINGYPKGTELIGFLWFRILEAPVLTLTTFQFLPLGVLGIAFLAIQLGASRRFAVVVGSAFLLIPVVVSQTVTTYADAAHGACVIALCACTVALGNRTKGGAENWRLLPGTGCVAGLTLATKGSGIVPVLLSGLVLLAGAFWRSQRGTSRFQRELLHLISLMLLTGLVGSYWNCRNWVRKDNPLFPVEVALGGHTLFPGIPLSVAISENFNTPASMASSGPIGKILTAWTQNAPGGYPNSIRYFDSREGGLGFLWLMAGLPAILVCVIRASRTGAAARPLFTMIGMIAVLFLSTPMNWWARYTVWLHGVGLPALGASLTHLTSFERTRPVRRLGFAWLALCCGLGGYEAFYVFGWSATTGRVLGAPRPVFPLTQLWRSLTHFEGAAYALGELDARYPLTLEALASREPVGLSPPTEFTVLTFGQLSTSPGARLLVPLGESVSANDTSLREIVQRYDLRYVLWNQRLGAAPALEKQAFRAERFAQHWTTYAFGPGGAK